MTGIQKRSVKIMKKYETHECIFSKRIQRKQPNIAKNSQKELKSRIHSGHKNYFFLLKDIFFSGIEIYFFFRYFFREFIPFRDFFSEVLFLAGSSGHFF